MARLREINNALDNQIRNLNRKAEAAARASGSSSKTFKEASDLMQQISRATGAPISYKNINGTNVPVLSRASKHYQNLAPANQIALDARMGAEKLIKGIKAEIAGYYASEGQQMPSSYKTAVAGFNKLSGLHSKLDDKSGYEAISWLLDEDVTAIKQGLIVAIYGDNYDAWAVEIEEAVKTAIKDEEDYIEVLKRDYDTAKDAEVKEELREKISYEQRMLDAARGEYQQLLNKRRKRRGAGYYEDK